AHDFGNILTGILGFSELALKQVGPDSPSYRFVQESHRAAQQGAELTRLLQMFGCRRGSQAPPSPPAAGTAPRGARLRPLLRPAVQLHVSVPAELPAVAVGEELLATVLGQLLENAHEALSGPGVIGLSARTTQLGEGDCRELLGNAGPGPCLEVSV